MDEAEHPPIKPTVGMEDLERLDIRIGAITAVDDVPNSTKLVKLTVDFGSHQRQVLVGMKKERTDPAEIVGYQAMFVINLEPKTMAGEVSEGMLLDHRLLRRDHPGPCGSGATGP